MSLLSGGDTTRSGTGSLVIGRLRSCRVLVTADNAKMTGFVHVLRVASNRSLACCSTLDTYIDDVSITKPRALAICVQFVEVRQLPLVMVRGDREPMQMSQEHAQKESLACCATLNTYNNAIYMTKPHAHTLCVRFTEVNLLSNELSYGRSTTKVTTTTTAQISMFDEVKLPNTANRLSPKRP